VDMQANLIQPKRKRESEFGRGEERTTEFESIPVVELSDIEKQYILTQAYLQLADKAASTLVGEANSRVIVKIPPKDTFTLLIQDGFYQTALNVAKAFKFMDELHLFFETLTKKCLQLQSRSTEIDMESEEDKYWLEALNEDYLTTTKEVGKTTLRWDCFDLYGPEAGWKMLENFLENYDTSKTNYQYRVRVAEKILSTDDRIKLPTWLVNSFKAKDCLELLLRVYLKYKLYEDATLIISDMITRASNQTRIFSENDNKKNSNLICLPYTLIDKLKTEVSQLPNDSNAKQLWYSVDKKLTDYLNRSQEVFAGKQD